MPRSRLIFLITVAVVVMFCTMTWFLRDHHPKSDVKFWPLSRIGGADGSTQQVFAVSNVTSSMVECVLGRYKTFATPEGLLTSNLESHAYARLAPWSGTQLTVALPSDGGKWRATAYYRRFLSQTELTARRMGQDMRFISSNQMFPVWQTTAGQEFEK